MKTKTVRVALNSFGSFLVKGMGCPVVRDNDGKVKRYPLLDNVISEVQIASASTVSAGALVTCGFRSIDLIVQIQWGNPIAVTNGKGSEIANKIVLVKIKAERVTKET